MSTTAGGIDTSSSGGGPADQFAVESLGENQEISGGNRLSAVFY